MRDPAPAWCERQEGCASRSARTPCRRSGHTADVAPAGSPEHMPFFMTRNQYIEKGAPNLFFWRKIRHTRAIDDPKFTQDALAESNTSSSKPDAMEQQKAATQKLDPGWTKEVVKQSAQLARLAIEESSSDPNALVPLRVLPAALLAPSRHTTLATHNSTPPSTPLGTPLGTPPAPPPPPAAAELLQSLQRWDFDVHAVASAELPALCFALLTANGRASALRIDESRLWRYVTTIAAHYHDRPFHNFRHAVDVTHATSCFLALAEAHSSASASAAALSPLQEFAQLLAAMVHDTDHPGVMNPFLIATRHPLALLYNDKSVLESHHAATAMALLADADNDFLTQMEPDDARTLRSLVIDLVLATDVTSTMPFMKSLNERLNAGEPAGTADLQYLIIKASDISNPTRPLETYQVWIKGVMSEFFAQGDAERALGLPISMNCDSHTVDVAKCQVGFISFLVEPLFECLAKVLPGVEAMCLETLRSNKTHFKGA